METTNLELFESLTEDELYEIDGGIIPEIIFGIVSIYIGLREVVRDYGRNQAYADMRAGR